MYSNTKAKVRCANGRLTNSFQCPTGVRQGCVLSSTLFISYLNDLEHYFIENGSQGIPLGVKQLILMMFADNLALVDNTIQGLQEKLEVLYRYCETWGLSVNVDKTKVMSFKRGGRHHRDEHWYYRNQEVESVKTFEYLGLTLSGSTP